MFNTIFQLSSRLREGLSLVQCLWNLNPRMSQCTYWFQKQQFSYKEDIYAEWVIFAVEDGSFHYEIGDREGIASFGDIVICPPGIPFYRDVITPLSFYYIRLQWVDGGGSLVHSHESIPVGKVKFKDTRRLASNYFRMKSLAGSPDPFYLSWIAVHLQDILYLHYAESIHSEPKEDVRRDPLMERACRLIEQKAYEAFSMKALSDELGLNPVQFTRRFQATQGMTPTDYLTGLRLKKACTLLITGGATIEEVAHQCGYENGYYLSRLFSKKLQMSPSAYRRTHQV